MGKKRRILFAVMLVIILGSLAWWPFRRSAPQLGYAGNSLDYWIEEYERNAADPKARLDKQERAREAIQKIGTNALPTLLQMAAVDDSTLKKKLERLVNRLQLYRIHLRTEMESQWMSTWGFIALGPSAKPAVPDLITLLSHKNPEVRNAAARDLGAIGTEAEAAIPALLKCLDDPEWRVRFSATETLEQIGKRPDLVVPILLKKIDESNRATNCYSVTIYTLAGYKDYSLTKNSVPRLVEFLNDQNFYTRSAATNALEDIDPAAAAKAGIK